MSKVAVLIPCYNEAKTIAKVVADFREALPEADIYVYDNNSTDGTGEIARGAGALVRVERKQGKGNVIRTMFREVEADCYLMADGDDTYPAEYAGEMARLVLEEQADMVIGDRLSATYFTENKRRFHNGGNRIVRDLVNRIFKGNLTDIMTGYRAFSYDFVKTFPVLSRGFEIETEMTIHAISHNMATENVVVDYRDRPEGSESKLNTYTDGLRVLSTVFNLFKNHRPFAFFGWFAFVLMIISAAFFIPMVLVPFVKTGLVEKFPTLIVCVFVALSAVFSFFSGVILDTAAYRDRQAFEFRMQQVDRWKKELTEHKS